tara:strand:+ start:7526 stop:8137 length:612 start_codon:yes stop_codon:yes gene_type:complete
MFTKNKVINVLGVKKQTNQCCICYENKINTLHCKRCNTGIICDNCVVNLIENGMYDNCPVCRKDNPWIVKGRPIQLPISDNIAIIDNNIAIGDNNIVIGDNNIVTNNRCKCNFSFNIDNYVNDRFKQCIYKFIRVISFLCLFFVVGLIYKSSNNECIFDCHNSLALNIFLIIFYGAATLTVIMCCILLIIIIIAALSKFCCKK